MTVAQRYLDAIHAESLAEAEVVESLIAFLGDVVDFDIAADPYDGSLEVYAPALAADQVAPLAAHVLSLGFARCWIHPHEEDGWCDRAHYFAAPEVKP